MSIVACSWFASAATMLVASTFALKIYADVRGRAAGRTERSPVSLDLLVRINCHLCLVFLSLLVGCLFFCVGHHMVYFLRAR